MMDYLTTVKKYHIHFKYTAIGFLFIFCLWSCFSYAQTPKQLKSKLAIYFDNYTTNTYSSNEKIKIENISIDTEQKRVQISLNEAFSTQPFTPQIVTDIKSEVSQLLPPPYNNYQLTILAGGYPLEELVPIHLQPSPFPGRTYQKTMLHGNPWVTPMSLPSRIEHGLQGHHLCVWASHGKYFNVKKQEWIWQRPRLFCTSEDLFTQTIVIPYLIPMLQNAGAVVFSPRERDWQKNEIIIDNDKPQANGIYTEINDRYQWVHCDTGFAQVRSFYLDHQNPFKEGTCRMIDATDQKRQLSSIVWTPNIAQEGDYAVYVSYKTLPTSVSDALYTVVHQGIETQFRVNQKMGGGTWVYLGTFHFDAGENAGNCITLSNLSNYRGTITADAVRLGGGMGNVLRMYGNMTEPIGSGMPRFLEAARYYAQWAGMPFQVYSAKEGQDDYGDDINARPRMENYLSRGSLYNPGDSGLCVPLELSLAIHSDAGVRRDSTHIGTLGIYTTGFYDGITATGLSRLTSRDLTDMVVSSVCNDIRQHFGSWNRRQMYDRNYGETREPQLPAMILETMSHQNWADLMKGHDPYFKFILARAIYKGVLQYIKNVHCKDRVVTQPLPVHGLSAHVDESGENVLLSWMPTIDLYDETAEPTDYVIYISEGQKGFDNGRLISARHQECQIKIAPNTLYLFRVAAVNDGGYSLPSEEVCAYYAGAEAPRICIVDGFNRVAGPQPFDTPTSQGFDMDTEPGVVDRRMPGYCGYQLFYEKAGYGREGSNGLGFSGSELEGMILAGNTHDYSVRHARDILAGGNYTIGSCTSDVAKDIPLQFYQLIDVVMGAQKADGYSMRTYKTFTDDLKQTLSNYSRLGGSILASGAFIGSDMKSAEDKYFTENILKYSHYTAISTDSLNTIQGMNTTASLYNTPNEQNYWIRQADVLQAAEGAFCSMLYAGCGQSAGIAYSGNDYRTMSFGFPLECIQDTETRRSIISASIRFLLNIN